MKKQAQNYSPQSDIPADKNLPGLAAMLDSKMIKTTLAAHFLKLGASLTYCVVSYIRYKPRTSCIIVYRIGFNKKIAFGLNEIPVFVKIHTKQKYKTAEEKSSLHRWTDPCGIGAYKLLPEYSAIFYFFPNDPVIDGLRIIENPKKIQRILYQHYREYPKKEWRISDRKLEFTIIRYKPERRAVIRFDTRAVNLADGSKEKISVYARIYADDRGKKVFETQSELYRLSRIGKRFVIPRPIAYLSDRRVLLMERLRGKILLDFIIDGENKAIAHAARAIASLHSINLDILPEISSKYLIEQADASLSMISEIAAGFSDTARSIHRSLIKLIENFSPTAGGIVHGDFYPGQVIISDGEAGIIDFDRSCAGDPIADIGNFLAHLKLLSLRNTMNYGEIENIFISAYEKNAGRRIDENRLRFWTSFSLFQLAVNPFRGLEPEWPASTGRILNECRKLLS